MANNEIVKFEASLNNAGSCVRIDNDGSAVVIFNTDATQLAKVLNLFGIKKNSLLEISVKRLSGDYQNGSEKGRARKRSKTYR